MKKVIFFLLITILGGAVQAQPNYSLTIYKVQRGKNANFYLRESKRLIKAADYNAAVLNGATALKLADKKRHFSEGQERLNDSYDFALEDNLAKIEALVESTSSFENDRTVTQKAELIRVYKTMIAINDLLASVPEKNFRPVKKKDSGFNYEPLDYSERLKVAKANFEKLKEEAAAMHYADGRALETSESKSELRNSSRHFKWANQYVPNYRDASDRYEAVKKLATTRMGVSNFDASSVEYGNLGAKVSEMLLSSLIDRSRSLEFFEVIDREQLDLVIKEQELSLSGLMDESTTADIGELKGVDVILVGTITESIIDRQEAGPTERSYTKEVVIRKEKYTDEDGKEKTRDIKGDVTAITKEYSKSAEASVGCTFKVVDIRTGQVLESGSITGRETWQFEWISSFRGDKRALPSMAREEKKYPSISTMTNNAAKRASGAVLGDLQSYLNQVGK